VKNNLRFAGQYYDQETGLHYNYHRYYDPKLGRYLRADPIGLDGGINLYSYVSNNPINSFDMLGLDECSYNPDGSVQCKIPPQPPANGASEGTCPKFWSSGTTIETIGPNKATGLGKWLDEPYQFQRARKTDWILFEQQGKCGCEIKEITCTYHVTKYFGYRKRRYFKETKTFGDWSDWTTNNGKLPDYVVTVQYDCEKKGFK
jgi:RHS repeat-associated protein